MPANPARHAVLIPCGGADGRQFNTLGESTTYRITSGATAPREQTDVLPELRRSSRGSLLYQMRGACEPAVTVRRLFASVFGGPDGKQLKASIMDENPVTPAAIKLTVNSRYPDTVPLTTVPPQVLQTMPKLTEDLEYRFIGDALILLDVHAHVIADFIEDVLPK